MAGEEIGRGRGVNDKRFHCGTTMLDPTLLELLSADITHVEEREGKMTSDVV